MRIKNLSKVDKPREKLEIIKNPNLEKFLLHNLPRNDFRKAFRARLKIASPLGDYWQIMSEMRAIHIFHNILKIPVEGIETRTVKKKDVDFVCDWHGKEVYVEVKGFRPIDYVVARRGGWIGADEEKIDRALARSQNKFLNNCNNIVVIADENTIRLPLFMNQLTDLEKTPEIYLNSADYIKTSAVIILGGMYYDQQFKYKIWYNASPEKSLPNNLMDLFNQHKSNAY